MLARSLIVGVASVAFGVAISVANAENFDPEGRFTNGFCRQTYTPGYSPIARASVSAPGSYGPNTIVMDRRSAMASASAAPALRGPA